MNSAGGSNGAASQQQHLAMTLLNLRLRKVYSVVNQIEAQIQAIGAGGSSGNAELNAQVQRMDGGIGTVDSTKYLIADGLATHEQTFENIRVVLLALVEAATMSAFDPFASLLTIAANASSMALLVTEDYLASEQAAQIHLIFAQQISAILARLVTLEHDLNVNSSNVMTTEDPPKPATSTTTGTPGAESGSGRNLAGITTPETTINNRLAIIEYQDLDNRVTYQEATVGPAFNQKLINLQAEVDAIVAETTAPTSPEISALNTRVDNLIAVVNTSNAKIKVLEDYAAADDAEVDQLTVTVNNQTAIINALKARVDTLETDHTGIVSRAATLTEVVNVQRADINTNVASIDALRGQSAAAAAARLDVLEALNIDTRITGNNLNLGTMIRLFKKEMNFSAMMKQFDGAAFSVTFKAPVRDTRIVSAGTYLLVDHSYDTQVANYMQYYVSDDPTQVDTNFIHNGNLRLQLQQTLADRIREMTDFTREDVLQFAGDVNYPTSISTNRRYKDSGTMDEINVHRTLYYYVTGTFQFTHQIGQNHKWIYRVISSYMTITASAPTSTQTIVSQSTSGTTGSSNNVISVSMDYTTPLYKAFDDFSDSANPIYLALVIQNVDSNLQGFVCTQDAFAYATVHFKWLPTNRTYHANSMVAMNNLYQSDPSL